MKPRLLTLLLLAGFLWNCVDEIDLNQGDSLPDGIVVRGRLNVAEGADVEINLERLFQFSSNLPDRVATAQVLLENTEGQSLLIPFRDGSYKLDIGLDNPEMEIRAGIGYRVSIATREGEMYASEFDVLQEPTPIESISKELVSVPFINAAGIEDVRPAFTYSIDVPVRDSNGEPLKLRHTFETTYGLTDFPLIAPYSGNDPKKCYLTRPLGSSEVSVLDGSQLSTDRVDDYEVFTFPIDHRFAEGNYFTVYQEVLSRDAFEYFDQIANIASQEQSIFSVPGGPIDGNVSDVNGNTSNVFGFFYAANRTLIRLGTSPEEAGNPNVLCPLPPSMSPFPPPTGCDECTLFFGSSAVPPPFWQF